MLPQVRLRQDRAVKDQSRNQEARDVRGGFDLGSSKRRCMENAKTRANFARAQKTANEQGDRVILFRA